MSSGGGGPPGADHSRRDGEPADATGTRRIPTWARLLGAIGKALIAAGTLVLLFVAYQLWGTAIREAQAQDRLEDEFAERLATTTTTEPRPGTTATTAPPQPLPDDGSAVARIRIPDIGLDKIVVEGVGVEDLKRGPGRYPDTPLPGEPGNAAIAGHRTTYGAPFNRIDELEPGDEILVTTFDGESRYEVADTEGDGNGNLIVAPTQVDVLNDKGDDRLTLTSCHPEYSARQRIIVVALLTGDPVDPGPVDAPRPPDVPQPTAPERSSIDGGLDGDRSSMWPAIWWAIACAAMFALVWVLGRRWRRWPAYVLGAPPLLVLLFYFFESFARLLPASY